MQLYMCYVMTIKKSPRDQEETRSARGYHEEDDDRDPIPSHVIFSLYIKVLTRSRHNSEIIASCWKSFMDSARDPFFINIIKDKGSALFSSFGTQRVTPRVRNIHSERMIYYYPEVMFRIYFKRCFIYPAASIESVGKF